MFNAIVREKNSSLTKQGPLSVTKTSGIPNGEKSVCDSSITFADVDDSVG